MANKTFVDANVLLEIALSRPSVDLATQAVRRYAPNLHVSVLSVHLLVYFASKIATPEGLRALLSDYTIVEMSRVDVDWAFTNMRDDDFEDALQLAVAIRSGCDTFVTFDKQLNNTYKGLPQLRIKLLSELLTLNS